MTPLLFLTLASAPLLAACAGESRRAAAELAVVEPPARAAPSAQPGPDADWAAAVVAAKASGSLYRGGAFFPDAAAGIHPAVAVP